MRNEPCALICHKSARVALQKPVVHLLVLQLHITEETLLMSHQRVLLLLLSAALLGADRVKVRVRLFAALRQAGRQHAAPPPAATHPPLPRPAGPLAVSPRREVVLRVEVRRLSDVRGTVQPRARDLGRVDVPPAVVLLQPLLLDVGEGEGAVDGGREVAGGGARADDGVRDAARLDPVHLRLQHHPQRLTLLLLVGALRSQPTSQQSASTPQNARAPTQNYPRDCFSISIAFAVKH
mmetsp:Transcript_30910/g.55326  ORF Transcript_30910/g.55326 Transcript_30910/m.55326 type:complete len:237 (-) Transcript_30910:749-1459(-)